MNKNRTALFLALVSTASVSFGCGSTIEATALADEVAGSQVKDAATDLKRDVKKGTRKVSRKVRKATGNDSIGKDVHDKVNDIGDDLEAASTKASSHKNNN